MINNEKIDRQMELVTTGMEVMVPPPMEKMVLSLNPETQQAIDDLLSRGGMIGRVNSDAENAASVAIQIEQKNMLNLLEKTRVEHTKVALEYQRALKAFFDGKAKDLKEDNIRQSMLTAQWGSLQLAKQRAAENAKREELSRIEREREAALAKAQSHDQMDAIQEHFNKEAALESSVPVEASPLAKGQSVAPDIEVVVYDIYALVKAFPHVCKIEAKMTDLKALVRSGIKVPGVRVEEVAKQTIRASRTKAIDV